jgi:hypothetical protein
MPDVALRPTSVMVGIGRAGGGIVVVAVLVYGYALRIAVGDSNVFDYFGYFTNQTSLLASTVLIMTGVRILRGERIPPTLTLLRGMATSYLLVVALIYNLLVPGTGSAPPWISTLLHVVFPLLVACDWLFIGDRPHLPWRRLWLVLPYPVLWLIAVLIRGVPVRIPPFRTRLGLPHRPHRWAARSHHCRWSARMGCQRNTRHRFRATTRPSTNVTLGAS